MRKYKKIYIEITNVCNLSCRFCPKTKRKSDFLDVDRFKHILKEIKPFGEYIYFHLLGEPLLNKNLGEFLKLSNENGFKANITTNGTLLIKNKEVLHKADGLRQINISLHSFEANDIDISFEEYVREVLSFIKEGIDKTKTIYALRLWNEDGRGEKGENSLNSKILSIIKEELALDFDLEEKFKKDRRVKLLDRVYLNGGDKFQWPTLEIEPLGDEGFCYGLRDQFGILVDGTVVPCCLDGEGKIPLGNIYNETLKDILEGKRAKAIYDGFTERKMVEELCKRCGYSRIFTK